MDLQDLIQQRVIEQSSGDPYLRYASDSDATMFSDATLSAVGLGKIERGDATENCCRDPAGLDCKRILYYAFVIFVCGFVVPVLEFISAEHKVCVIQWRIYQGGKVIT